MEQRRRLAEMIRAGRFFVLPTCTNAMTARIVERLGFDAVYLGGYAFGAASAITEPLTTMMEMVTAAGHIARRINVPLVVDGDAGFGEPLHTMRMIREMEAAGIAATHIEDQQVPKRAHYHRNYQEHSVTLEEFADKIRMAVKARQDPDFLIFARTDSQKTYGYEAAVQRLNAAVAAGADAVLCHPGTREEAVRITRDVKAPLGYINSRGNQIGRPVLTAQEAEELGYTFLMEPLPAVLVTLKAIKDVYGGLKAHGRCNLDNEEARALRDEIEEIIQLPEHYAIEAETVERG